MKHIVLLILLTFGVWAQEINDKYQDSLKITRLAMMEKTHQLVAGDNNGIIHFLTPDPLEETRSFKAHDSEITQIVFPENEQFFFTTAKDKTIKQWATKTLKLIHTYEGHDNIVSHIDVTPDGETLVSGDDQLNICFWDIENFTLEKLLSKDIILKTLECSYYEGFSIPFDPKTYNDKFLGLKIIQDKLFFLDDRRLFIYTKQGQKIKEYCASGYFSSEQQLSKDKKQLFGSGKFGLYVIDINSLETKYLIKQQSIPNFVLTNETMPITGLINTSSNTLHKIVIYGEDKPLDFEIIQNFFSIKKKITSNMIVANNVFYAGTIDGRIEALNLLSGNSNLMNKSQTK